MKTPYDFCYVYRDGEVLTLDMFLFEEKIPPSFCGLSPVPHFPGSYVLYFDHSFRNGLSPKRFLGICDNEDILVSNIPNGLCAVEIVHFDKEEFEHQK